jgi:hypothetical protein
VSKGMNAFGKGCVARSWFSTGLGADVGRNGKKNVSERNLFELLAENRNGT